MAKAGQGTAQGERGGGDSCGFQKFASRLNRCVHGGDLLSYLVKLQYTQGTKDKANLISKNVSAVLEAGFRAVWVQVEKPRYSLTGYFSQGTAPDLMM